MLTSAIVDTAATWRDEQVKNMKFEMNGYLLFVLAVKKRFFGPVNVYVVLVQL